MAIIVVITKNFALMIVTNDLCFHPLPVFQTFRRSIEGEGDDVSRVFPWI